jgi:hypothetical protein
MLKTFQKMVAGEATEQPRADTPMRALLAAAETTRKSSNLKPVPVDTLVQNASRAHGRVVDAELDVDKCERALAAARKALTTAETNRLIAQNALLRRCLKEGALEGVRDFNALIRAGDIEDISEIENVHD